MKIAVIGTGTLGSSIAQVFSQCNSIEKVFLCKGRLESKKTGLESITKAFEKLVTKEQLFPSLIRDYLFNNRY